MDKESRAGMIKKTAQSNTEQKLPYEKPKMTAVSLFADEVLSGCAKTSPAPFPGCGGSVSTS
ncbi:MAG: hypothetical protein D3925_11590 [Candidatus Electrothrix sp. AR5]|nr:hypothetical protein [Candidatus Electrothrix sp. AR5]